MSALERDMVAFLGVRHGHAEAERKVRAWRRTKTKARMRFYADAGFPFALLLEQAERAK